MPILSALTGRSGGKVADADPAGGAPAGNNRFGVLLGVGATGVIVGQDGSPNQIGNSGTGVPFKGSVDEIAIYRDVLASRAGAALGAAS